MKTVVIFLAFSFGILHLYAGGNGQLNSAEILLNMERLGNTGSVLYIAAHPDDENTNLLAYLVSEKKLRVGYLSLTRGDGGQNLIGKEQGEPLGLLRTQELLAARKIDGAEQFFSRAYDFGYSKNPEETFSIWNKDSILADIVWVIRTFRPDVIITRFPSTGEGGHGHHTASAILAIEAFDAAADPTRFTEQLQYTSTWQAKRLYWNSFAIGNNSVAEGEISFDDGGFNTLLGKSYGAISALSRSMHKCQGMGTPPLRGSNMEYFKYLKGDPAPGSSDLFGDIDLSWVRVPGGSTVDAAIKEMINKYDLTKPENSLSALASIYRMLRELPEGSIDIAYLKQRKLEETKKLMLACAGIFLEASSSEYSTTPGGKITITLQALSRLAEGVELQKIYFFPQDDSVIDISMNRNTLYTFIHEYTVHPKIEYSDPYWLKSKRNTKGEFVINDLLQTGQPESGALVYARADLEIAGQVLAVIIPVEFKYTDPVRGEVHRPLEILPIVNVNPAEKNMVFAGEEPRNIAIRIIANEPGIRGVLTATAIDGWSVKIKDSLFFLTNKGDEILIHATVKCYGNKQSGLLSFRVLTRDKEYSKSIRRVEYDHIPAQFMLSEAEVKLVNVDLKTAGTNIGYIPGAGDEIPASLKQVGYDVTTMTDEMLSGGSLDKFDAIVCGVRAFNVNPRLQVHHQKLMDYINGGGNLIVQYNTPFTASVKIGPYPFTITSSRVTDENAEVRFIDPNSEVLNIPNRITPADFVGWIQERGTYFAGDIDPHYEKILSMNDAGEGPLDGSLIAAKYGKGYFVYSGVAFFRELPAGVGGAYRLFVNLLSLGLGRE
ncbi:MAG: PIG-L family deacetylase [Ignavibacteria bacterium]|nr:PIG-L family deacetylase [Ignavibacteria bacterium]